MNPSLAISPNGGSLDLGDGCNAIAIDTPNSVDSLRDCIRKRSAEGMAVYPRGGATALDYGGVPRSPGVGIATAALNQVVDYPAADMTITIEAGLPLKSLQAILREQNQRLLIEAPQAEHATIGGIYATNTSGPRRFGAGGPRDQILGVSFVDAEGRLIKGGGRVVKNVAGYDFPKLLTGSLGTLGVITQMTLKVRPLPEASTIVWVPLPSLESVETTLERLNTSTARPIALELLNREAAGRVGNPLNLPADDWNLAIGLEDSATSVHWQTERLLLELGRPNIVIEQDADAEPLWTALVEFQAAAIGLLTFSANLRPSMIASFLRRLEPDTWAVQVRAGNGIVVGHYLGETTAEAIAPVLDALRFEAVKAGGNLILPRCPAPWKSMLKVWGEPRADWHIAERIKQAFDPRSVFNPGRFVGSI